MKPLRPASATPESRERLYVDLYRLWVAGDTAVRAQFQAGDAVAARACISDYLDKMEADEQIYKNNQYQVHVRDCGDTIVHLSIRRIDRQPIHDWRDLQEIKNQLVGSECEGVELYPAESRRVDSANQFHIWCSKDRAFRFPFGFQERLVTNDSLGGSVNRPLAEREASS